MKYFIKTFGCQMNYSDSERIAAILEKNNIKPVSDIQKASIVIFNTCGIRQAAEDRALSIIHTLRKKYPDMKIVLTGCLANRKDIQKKLKNKVDLFFPINKFDLFENFIIASQRLVRLGRKNYLPDKENIAYLSIKPKYKNNYSAFVPIMTGCNNFCSYCVVPYARGREVSRPAKEIICEIKNLIKNGCKEIILLGQNVNSYNDGKINFPQLLKKINAIPGKFWIRFVSSHPKDFSDELIETITKSKKVCEHIHLPIQAGSDKILQKMNRKYTAKHYLNLIRKIKNAFKKYKPNTLYSLTSDIIVGFPGETKKQFLESAKIMEKAKYDLVFFGQFSPRPETVAWKMKDNVSKIEKARREKFLNEILKKTALSNNKKYKNTVQEVLIISTGSKSPLNGLLEPDGYIHFGKTRTGKNVKIHLTPCLAGRQAALSLPKRGGDNLVGKFIKVKITKANVWNLEGKLEK